MLVLRTHSAVDLASASHDTYLDSVDAWIANGAPNSTPDGPQENPPVDGTSEGEHGRSNRVVSA